MSVQSGQTRRSVVAGLGFGAGHDAADRGIYRDERKKDDGSRVGDVVGAGLVAVYVVVNEDRFTVGRCPR